MNERDWLLLAWCRDSLNDRKDHLVSVLANTVTKLNCAGMVCTVQQDPIM